VESVPGWVPDDVDLSRPSAARLYDYYLGGAHNFGVDRELARKVLALFPDGAVIAQANRAFLHRVVRFMLDAGIRQFVDIGSGIPTSGNVHEVAQQAAPEAKVLYVDNDPVAVAHSELILAGNENAAVLRADFRRPEEILRAPVLGELLDLSQPVGILLIALLHFVSEDDRPADTIGALRDLVAPGSYLAISHGTGESRPAEAAGIAELYRATTTPITYRSRNQVTALFDGWDVIDPGVVWAPQWRPDWPDDVPEDPAALMVVGGVGRKP
jgi:hypothetical protein